MNQILPSNQTSCCVSSVSKDVLLQWPIMTRDGGEAIVMRVGAHGSIQHPAVCGVGTMVHTGLIIWPTPLIYILTPHWTRHMSPVTAPLHCWPQHLLGWEESTAEQTYIQRRNWEILCIFRNILHGSSHPMQRTERRIMLCLGLYFVSSCKLEMS